MNYKVYDVIEFDDDEKVVVLETLEYEGNIYLYVDKVNQEETTTLKEFHILRVEENDYLEKEVRIDILEKILPIFKDKVNKNEQL